MTQCCCLVFRRSFYSSVVVPTQILHSCKDPSLDDGFCLSKEYIIHKMTAVHEAIP